MSANLILSLFALAALPFALPADGTSPAHGPVNAPLTSTNKTAGPKEVSPAKRKSADPSTSDLVVETVHTFERLLSDVGGDAEADMKANDSNANVDMRIDRHTAKPDSANAAPAAPKTVDIKMSTKLSDKQWRYRIECNLHVRQPRWKLPKHEDGSHVSPEQAIQEIKRFADRVRQLDGTGTFDARVTYRGGLKLRRHVTLSPHHTSLPGSPNK